MSKTISVIGLGYVGLPLAVAFSKKYKVIGFDINNERIRELKSGYDRTLEVGEDELKEALNRGIEFTSSLEDIKDANIYIVTVPTPIDKHKNPDLTPLIMASRSVGRVLKKGDIVIYESTVYPGCTEEVCVPELERESGLKFNKDFFVGYSPERINPGDKEHTVTKILKVTSGSTPEIAKEIDELYASIIEAGTHLAPSIKVAEAAKVIENSQRDINIAFVNELALIFDKLGIDTNEVLEAAGTKWNFLKFKPGLVGGHCIGVDPYYLTYKAKEIGYHPEIILAGRRLNDNMGIFVANKVVKLMIQKGHTIKGSKVLVLGITFKENCPDIRNSRVIDVIRELQDFGISVDVYDPWADKEEVKREYNFDLMENGQMKIENYDAVVLAVAHNEFKELESEIKEIKDNKKDLVVYDIKDFFYKNIVDGRL
ncbi:Vi polysaccharide biosynthesis UDP-N-acetylglucosamine C-6 dehydrogenase TviB [Caminibacter mediatlanticus]|uniref:Udp-glucose 6-dehydrogenase n=1 Tax=Caminibacter mediatlanticus TB-2 TaxID=391592 RepID=A0AAI9AGQ1_9BACT|nr:Vi polysaccharide biosynthesis UDP-N-acetylglucosamine C-6 dehydrogenase TviB [Caminibacter mediatlanticus]EDM23169.1 putative udp-glucose 6-dehydrogenase [Caminibacter mediatlanticus TB-2]